MEFVDVQPGAAAGRLVADHAVPHLVDDDHHAERAELAGQAGHVEHGEPVGKVDVGLPVEAAHGAGNVRVERVGEVPALVVAAVLELVVQVLQRGLGDAAALVAVARVQVADALVDESLLERIEAVDAADESADHGDHVVGLVLDGVGGRVVVQDDVHRVDARAGAGADLDDLSAERGREGEVFAFRVDDDDLVVPVEEHAGDLLFDGEGFAAAGRAEHEPVGVHVAAPVREDRVAGAGVAAVEQAVGFEHLLSGERDEDGGGIRGQGAFHGQRVVAQGQFGGQSLHLHELEALGRA